MTEKKELRKTMMQLRNNMSPNPKNELDRNIRKKLSELIASRKFRVVHSFLPMGSEIDILPLLSELINSGVTVIAPKTLPARRLENLVLHSVMELEAGTWGTAHPAGGSTYDGPIDLFIIPGLAFDTNCNRLGYGAGYYDNHLVAHTRAYKAGICYPFQMVDKVPTEPHDVQLHEIFY